MNAGAIIARRQNRYIRAFRNAEANTPDTARTLEQLAVRDSWIFDRLVARGVFVSAGDSRWFIDETAASAFIHRRYVKIAIVLAIFIATWLIVIAVSR